MHEVDARGGCIGWVHVVDAGGGCRRNFSKRLHYLREPVAKKSAPPGHSVSTVAGRTNRCRGRLSCNV